MYTPSLELRSLQLKCTEILDYVDHFCRAHHIDYALCGGSAIGAYMYEGFIPWDDDIDIMMTRNNYKRFLKLWKREKHDYVLFHYSTNSNVKIMFAKVIDPNTTIIEEYAGAKKNVSGVFIDITVFDYCSGEVISKCKRKIARLCYYLNQSIDNPEMTKMHRILSRTPTWLRILIIRLSDLFMQVHMPSSKEVQEYWAMDGECDTIRYPISLFSEYEDAVFEGRQFKVLKENYKYLTIAFNRTDFHIPESQQVPHHYAFLDLTRSYKEYQDR